MSATKLLALTLLLLALNQGFASFDYGAALTKSILYYEAQRSGKLPANQRVKWRGDSGLKDGSDNNIDLVGGYYDAGDNMKFHFPLAYTMTMLAWSTFEFANELAAKNELGNALAAVKWGTDYLIKAHPQPNVLYAQVGEGQKDHECWQRPEDMTTPRTSFKIDEQHPGSDLAAEVAAAFAASAIAFKKSNPTYSSLLLKHAQQLFEFAKNHRGRYSDSVPDAKTFYESRDEQDEMLWAALWLLRATSNTNYYGGYVEAYSGTGWIRSMFSWEDKYVGVQFLVIEQQHYTQFLKNHSKWEDYNIALSEFICNCVQKGNSNIKTTPAGLSWFNEWNNLQYTSSAAFIATVYANHIGRNGIQMTCADGDVTPDELIAYAKSQVDYILGENPSGISYMVGYGSNYPTHIHHRAASIPSIKTRPAPVTCKGGFDWYNTNNNDSNVLEGALVGGPNENDGYSDTRSNFAQAEAATANNAPLVGVLAKIASKF
ncbi:Endoglucanase [Thalictrum thalictroides]|uniref:Endoglucanase n=1 Tax=Thalictrum thalictroides TaxID=46969 RepID=A0A7J6WUG6_THATH|nr:Endoglucanase [Thalictrum thalictroides]